MWGKAALVFTGGGEGWEEQPRVMEMSLAFWCGFFSIQRSHALTESSFVVTGHGIE